MSFYEIVRLIEKMGYTNYKGRRVGGTAALVHIAHCKIKDLNSASINTGKTYVRNLLEI